MCFFYTGPCIWNVLTFLLSDCLISTTHVLEKMWYHVVNTKPLTIYSLFCAEMSQNRNTQPMYLNVFCFQIVGKVTGKEGVGRLKEKWIGFFFASRILVLLEPQFDSKFISWNYQKHRVLSHTACQKLTHLGIMISSISICFSWVERFFRFAREGGKCVFLYFSFFRDRHKGRWAEKALP